MQSSPAASLPRVRALSLGPTLFESLVPGARIWHKVVALVALVVLIILCAKARFFLPDSPTPVTMQTFAILFAGGLMGWRWGAGTVLTYLAIGALGVPVFATTTSLEFTTPLVAWNSILTGVVGGYLIGFLVASSVAGLLSQLGFTHRDTLWANLAGGLLLYVPALIWLSVFDFTWPKEGKLLLDAMYVYLPGDLLKILAVSLVTWGLWSRFANREQR